MRSGQSDRARIGLGTLVVFLSMVLAASIAAGVLLNTTGLLQGGAAAAGGKESSSEAARILVVGETGEHVRDGTVGVVNLTVTTTPDAEPVDLRKTTLMWVGPSGAYHVLHDDAAGGRDGPTFHVTPLSDPDGSAPVLDEADDRMVLTVDLGGRDDVAAVGEFAHGLHPGDTVKVGLTTGDGKTTQTRLAVPPSLANRNTVVL